MKAQLAVEIVLALAVVLLFARDLHRTWLDQLRRPISLLMPALMAMIFLGAVGGRPYPSPWWLALPGGILAWELVRGWRRVPRSHLHEAADGAFAVSLLLYGLGLIGPSGTVATVLLTAAAGFAFLGLALLWRAARREPSPARSDDASHYERRSGERPRV